MKWTLTLALLCAVTGCKAPARGPIAPPKPMLGKADAPACQYHCADYDYEAGQCYEGWQCDAQGICLTYEGTPGDPDGCHASCTPTTCAALGANCGALADGCGGMLSCGECGTKDTCGGGGTANVCGHPGCTATTCAALGYNCGTVADGCGGTLDCGDGCGGGDTCGGGGTPNVCGHPACTPATCVGFGKNCGTLGDGCGGTLDCGTCSGSDTCGGGGTPNVCGHQSVCNGGVQCWADCWNADDCTADGCPIGSECHSGCCKSSG